MEPNPRRGLFAICWLLGLPVGLVDVTVGSGVHILIGWFILGGMALAVAVWALIHTVGTDADRAEYPGLRSLVRRTRDDLRPVPGYVATTWRNIGGW